MREKAKQKACVGLILMISAALCLPAMSFGQGKGELFLLYFPRMDRPGLGLEPREVDQAFTLSGRVERLLQAVLAGPRTDLAPAFGPGVGLRQVFIDLPGTAFVDLSKTKEATGLGAVQERLGLWALVNTLCMNFQEINAVKILVNGGEAATLFGHVDLSRPLLPDDGLIK